MPRIVTKIVEALPPLSVTQIVTSVLSHFAPKIQETIQAIEAFLAAQPIGVLESTFVSMKSKLEEHALEKEMKIYFPNLLLKDLTKLPFEDYAQDPENVSQIKKLFNVLHHAYHGLIFLRDLEIRDTLSSAEKALAKLGNPECQKMGALRVLGDFLWSRQNFNKEKWRTVFLFKVTFQKDINLLNRLNLEFILNENTKNALNHIYKAVYLLTHIDVDVLELFKTELAFIAPLIERLSWFIDERAESQTAYALKEKLIQYKSTKKIGEITGIATEQLKPLNGHRNYDFLTQFSAELPSHIKDLSHEIEKFFNIAKENQPENPLNQKKIEELKKAALSLLNGLEQVKSTSAFTPFRFLKYTHIVRNIMTLFMSILEQIGRVNGSSQDAVCNLLSKMKYEQFPALFGLIDKVEINCLLKPGTLSEPVMEQIKKLYEEPDAAEKAYLERMQTSFSEFYTLIESLSHTTIPPKTPEQRDLEIRTKLTDDTKKALKKSYDVIQARIKQRDSAFHTELGKSLNLLLECTTIAAPQEHIPVQEKEKALKQREALLAKKDTVKRLVSSQGIVIFYASKMVNFAEKRPALQKVEDSHFVTLRLQYAYQRISDARRIAFKTQEEQATLDLFYPLIQRLAKHTSSQIMLPEDRTLLIDCYKILQPYVQAVDIELDRKISNELLLPQSTAQLIQYLGDLQVDKNKETLDNFLKLAQLLPSLPDASQTTELAKRKKLMQEYYKALSPHVQNIDKELDEKITHELALEQPPAQLRECLRSLEAKREKLSSSKIIQIGQLITKKQKTQELHIQLNNELIHTLREETPISLFPINTNDDVFTLDAFNYFVPEMFKRFFNLLESSQCRNKLVHELPDAIKTQLGVHYEFLKPYMHPEQSHDFNAILRGENPHKNKELSLKTIAWCQAGVFQWEKLKQEPNGEIGLERQTQFPHQNKIHHLITYKHQQEQQAFEQFIKLVEEARAHNLALPEWLTEKKQQLRQHHNVIKTYCDTLNINIETLLTQAAQRRFVSVSHSPVPEIIQLHTVITVLLGKKEQLKKRIDAQHEKEKAALEHFFKDLAENRSDNLAKKVQNPHNSVSEEVIAQLKTHYLLLAPYIDTCMFLDQKKELKDLITKKTPRVTGSREEENAKRLPLGKLTWEQINTLENLYQNKIHQLEHAKEKYHELITILKTHAKTSDKSIIITGLTPETKIDCQKLYNLCQPYFINAVLKEKKQLVISNAIQKIIDQKESIKKDISEKLNQKIIIEKIIRTAITGMNHITDDMVKKTTDEAIKKLNEEGLKKASNKNIKKAVEEAVKKSIGETISLSNEVIRKVTNEADLSKIPGEDIKTATEEAIKRATDEATKEATARAIKEVADFDKQWVNYLSDLGNKVEAPTTNLFAGFNEEVQEYFKETKEQWEAEIKPLRPAAIAKFMEERTARSLTAGPENARAYHILKHTQYSAAIHRFRSDLLQMVSFLNTPTQHALKLKKVTVQQKERWQLSTTDTLPYPELTDELEQHAQGTQVTALKKIFNLLYHAEQCMRELEKLEHKPSTALEMQWPKAEYCLILIQAGVCVHKIRKLILSLQHDPYFSFIGRTLIQKAQFMLSAIKEHSEAYKVSHTQIKEIEGSVQYNGLWYSLNAFYLFPKHVLSKMHHNELNVTELRALHQDAKTSALTIESIIKSSHSYFKLFLKSPAMFKLYKKLEHKLHEFTSTGYDLVINNIDKLGSTIFTPMLLEADRWEARLGLAPGILSGPLKTIIDEYYEGLQRPLKLKSKRYIDNLWSDKPLIKRKKATQAAIDRAIQNIDHVGKDYANINELAQRLIAYERLTNNKAAKAACGIAFDELINAYHKALPQLVIMNKRLAIEPNADKGQDRIDFDAQVNARLKEYQPKLTQIKKLIKASHHYYQSKKANYERARDAAQEQLTYLQGVETEHTKKKAKFIEHYAIESFKNEVERLCGRYIGFHLMKKEYSNKLRMHLEKNRDQIQQQAQATDDIDEYIKNALQNCAGLFERKHHKEYYHLETVRTALGAFVAYLNTVRTTTAHRGTLFENAETLKLKGELINELLAYANNKDRPIQDRLKDIRAKVEEEGFAQIILAKNTKHSHLAYLKFLFLSLCEALGLYTPESKKCLHKLNKAIKTEPEISKLTEQFGLFAQTAQNTPVAVGPRQEVPGSVSAVMAT